MANQGKSIEWSEVANHSTEEDCWIVIKNVVYNATNYLSDHPGGPIVIIKRAGKDATKQFEEAAHSENAVKKLDSLKVGVIAEGSVPLPGQLHVPSNAAQNIVGIAFLGFFIAFIIYKFVLNS